MLSRLSRRLMKEKQPRFSAVMRCARTLTDTATPTPAPPPPELHESMVPFRSFAPETGFVWKSRYGEITVPDMTLEEYVWKNVAKWQNKIAIVCGITGRKYSYGSLRDHCAAVAIRLRTEFHLQSGDVVAIAMPNIPEYAIIALGALEAGLTLTTINPAYTADEQAKQLAMTGAKMIFGVVESVPTILSARAKADSPAIPIVAVKTHRRQTIPDGIFDFANLMDTHNIDYSRLGPKTHRPDDVCVIPFSSGTTGLPKGVMLTHSNITSNLEMMDKPLCDGHFTLPTTNDFQDVFPCVLPYFHIYGFSFLMMSKLSLGCKLVTLPRFEPKTFVTVLAEHKATVLVLAPPLFLFLNNNDRVTTEHLAHTRTIISGAAPLGAEDVERLIKSKCRKVEILQGYGLTETSPMALIKHRLYTNHGTIGWPTASTEVKIVQTDDPQNKGMDVDMSGELLLRSPSVMKGYLNNKVATDEAIVDGGWLRTGDIGKYDANGDFYIVDRAKELIKVRGFQVAPAEMEEVLRSHPKVLDAGVIGVPNEASGEVPRAFVVVRDGERLTESEVQQYVELKCAKFKWLKGGVRFIDQVPKSATGKILRRELKRL